MDSSISRRKCDCGSLYRPCSRDSTYVPEIITTVWVCPECSNLILDYAACTLFNTKGERLRRLIDEAYCVFTYSGVAKFYKKHLKEDIKEWMNMVYYSKT